MDEIMKQLISKRSCSQMSKCILALLIFAAIVTSFQSSASAAFKPTGKEFNITATDGNGSRIRVDTYKIYKEDILRNRIYHNLDLCPPLKHVKNTGDSHLSNTYSKTYSTETTAFFSFALGYMCPIDVMERTTQIEFGLSKTSSVGFAPAGTLGKTIPSNSKTGFYKLSVVHDYYKYRADKYLGTQNTGVSYTIAIPYNKAYIAVLVGSTTADDSYGIFKP